MATETFIIQVQARGTKKAASNVRRIGDSAAKVRKTLAFLRNALVAVAAVRVFANLTQSLVAFSDEMLVVKAVTNATTLEFVRLREVAKGLGATTRFTASEAAEGMAFLARAGFEVNEVIGAIPGVLDLAAAAQLDLGNAADIASNLMTSFGLAVSDIPEIMDTLVFTANNANTTVQQLADGLKLFAPIASQLGISLKDASAAMAVLGDAGIQASLAGTGLRRIITDLEAPTGTLAKVLKALNISFDEVRPSVVGLEGSLQKLKDANLGASVASALFGKRGGFVGAQLLRSLGPLGDFRKELIKIEQTANDAAEVMESGLGGALRLVRSAFQNLLITFGDLGGEAFLDEFFRDLAEGLRVLARHADDAVAAVKILITVLVARKVLLFAKATILAGVALRTTAKQAVLAAGGFRKAIFASVSLRGALLRIPFVAILTTLGLLVAGFAAFRDEITLVGDESATLNDVFKTTSDLVSIEFTKAVNALGGEFGDFGEIIKTISSRVASAIEGIIAVFFGLLAVVKNVFGRIGIFFRLLVLSFDTVVNGLKSAINAASNAIGRGDVFAGVIQETKDLAIQTRALGEDIMDTQTLFESFLQGGRNFLDARRDTTSLRLIAERDAAIIATENANRAAAQARIVTPQEEVDPGRTLESILGDEDKERERIEDAFKGLEASISPFIAALEAEAEAQKIINEARAEGIQLRISEETIIKRVRREQLGANATLNQAAEEQRVLKDALDDTVISLEEFEFLSRKASIAFLEGQRDAASGAERAFLKLQQDATDAAQFTEMVMTDAFKAIEDAVVDFATTGTFSINDFFRNFGEQLLRLGTQQAIAGIGGAFPTIGGATTGASGGQAGIGGLFSSLIGLHEGGAFKVGANTAIQSLPGIDNRLVAFRAREGEEVTVTPRNQGGVGSIGPTNIVFNVTARDADSFVRSQPQLQNKLLAGISQARRRR